MPGIVLYVSSSDHTVIMGNHRDAWVFGAVDPNSGTAALMEIARAFSVLRKDGMRSSLDLVPRLLCPCH